MKKILSIILSVVVIAASVVPFSAFASSINTAQTAEAVSLNTPASATFKVGYTKKGNYDSFVDYDTKYYKFTAPANKYYEFEVTGYENGVYSQGRSGSADIWIKDSKGDYVTSAYTNEITGVTKDACSLKKGETYYIELCDEGLDNLSSYYDDNDWGYAEQTLTLSIKEHVHSMYVSDKSEYRIYYDCYYCDYYYSKEVECKHKHTEKSITKEATYWSTGKYNVYCTDCFKTVKKDVKISKKAVKLSSVKAGKKQATVKWNKVSGAKSYQIQYSTKSNFSGAKTVKATGTSKTIKKLKKGKKYYFRVKAVKGSKSSSWSKSKSAKIK